MIQVSIISGFLGAGKTTLIKKLIADAFTGEKVILLENEYGEVGIDGGFMKDSGIQVSELNSGCICCTMVGDFHAAIDTLIAQYSPDRIVIEPSGVGKLSEIRAVIEQAKERHPLQLQGCATVVDAGKCRMYMKNFGEFFSDQIKSAETVIFSRSQNVSQEKLDAAMALVQAENPQARIITTPWDQLDGKQILATIESPAALIDIFSLFPEAGHHHDEEEHEHHHDHDHDEHCSCHEHHHDHDHDEHCSCHEHHHDHDHDEHCSCHEHHHDHDHDEHCSCHEHHHDHDHDDHCSCGHHHHHHHHGHDADEVFENIGVETAHKFTSQQLDQALSRLSEEGSFGFVLRAKGILPAEDGTWLHFDYVPEEYSVRSGPADYTGRLCVIGTNLQENAIRALFGV